MVVASGVVAAGGLPAGGEAGGAAGGAAGGGAAGDDGAGAAGGVGTNVMVEGTFVTMPGLLGTWGAQIPARYERADWTVS